MTPEDHFRGLAEFIAGVNRAGGTTPHAAMTVESMRRKDDPLEKLWWAGCYALAYNWPTAEVIHNRWRPEVPLDETAFVSWLEENWAGVPIRKERKAIYRKPFFAESAAAYLRLAQTMADSDNWPQDYQAAYELFDNATRYMGRYIAIRWLEVMRRAYGLPWSMPDIHADGGQHPRKAMALIYPADAPALLGGNSSHERKVADLAADRLLVDLNLEYGISTDYYELQSLLCEYKQQVLARKQYPGKSIDTELAYRRRVVAHWGDTETDFWSVREACFPEWSLGEKQGWAGVRPELGSVLLDYGYTWSDDTYDYTATADFSQPVRRPGKEALLCHAV